MRDHKHKVLFARGYQNRKLNDYLRKGKRFIIVRGPRWSGKSYLVKMTLSSLDVSYIIIDVEEAMKKTGNQKFEILINKNLKAFLSENRESKVVYGHLQHRIHVNRSDLYQIFRKIDKAGKTVVVIDHADKMYLRSKMTKVFAATIDALDNITLIFTPKSTLRLEKILSVTDPEAPLHARGEVYIDLDYFSANESIDFLETHLEQSDCDYNLSELDYVYEHIGGSPKWLSVYVSYREIGFKMPSALEKTYHEARNEILSEVGENSWKAVILDAISRTMTSPFGYITRREVQTELEKSSSLFFPLENRLIREASPLVQKTEFSYLQFKNKRSKRVSSPILPQNISKYIAEMEVDGYLQRLPGGRYRPVLPIVIYSFKK